MYKGAIELLNGSPDPADINWYATEAEKHLGNLVSLAPILELHDVVMERLGLLAVENKPCSLEHRRRFQESLAAIAWRERDFDWIHPPNPSLSPALATRCHALTHASLIRASRPSHSGLFLLSFYTFFSHTPSLTSLTYRIHSLQRPHLAPTTFATCMLRP
jgi:hypothetical protein